MAPATGAAVTSAASTMTSVETPSLGNASLTRLIVCTTSMFCGSDSSRGLGQVHPERRHREGHQQPAGDQRREQRATQHPVDELVPRR